MIILFDKAGGDGNGTSAPTKDPAQAELNRSKAIRTAAKKLAEQFPESAQAFRDSADKAIDERKGVAAFNAELLEMIPGIRKAQVTKGVGMEAKDVKRYSLARAIASCVENKGQIDNCFEKDVSDQYKKQCGRELKISSNGFMVPPEVVMGLNRNDPLLRNAPLHSRTPGRRDLNVTAAAQGGDFVQTTIQTPIIEILRNRMVTQRLGIQMLSGLQGNIAIPRQTGAATAFTLAEQAALAKSTQIINQVTLSPKRVGAFNSYSKQLLLQSSVDVENFVRDDLMKVLAIKLDYLVLQGQGGAQPLGVKNTTGIAAITFGGAATWASILQFEQYLALANADIGRMSFVADPNARARWKNIPKIAASTFPIFLWENGNWNDGSNDGEVNSYRAACTNQIDNSQVGFGNWEDDILAMWGGYDVVVDPYTGAGNATVNIFINAFVDNCVRHAASFAWSVDPGNQ
jgi:HK97 family phage major capsid protein